jgi:hypothetical protein
MTSVQKASRSSRPYSIGENASGERPRGARHDQIPDGRSLGMEAFVDKASASLLRLMRSRQRSSLSEVSNAEIASDVAVTSREVQFSDFEAVAKLKESGGLRKDFLDNWYRLWRDNPALAKAKSPLSMGHVLEAKGRIVGYHGSIPLLYRYGDQTLLAATGHGLVVEPRYRFHSMGLVQAFWRQKNIDLLMVSTAIESVGKMSTLFRAKALPQRDYDTVLFFVLNSRRFARAVLKKLRVSEGIGRLGAAFGSLSQRMESTLHGRGPGRSSRKLPVTKIPVHQIGDDFEVLWQKKLTEKPRLLAERSAALLRWHFSQPGNDDRKTVLRCHLHGCLAGYAIVQYTMDCHTGLHRCRLVDMLIDGEAPDVAENLLAAAYSDAQASGADVFEVLGFPRSLRGILLRWRPYSRKYPACPFFYGTKDQSLGRMLTAEDSWYATPFDGDTTLIP